MALCSMSVFRALFKTLPSTFAANAIGVSPFFLDFCAPWVRSVIDARGVSDDPQLRCRLVSVLQDINNRNHGTALTTGSIHSRPVELLRNISVESSEVPAEM